MIPMPLELVPLFEQRLEKCWSNLKWTKARDAIAISFGLCGLRWNEVTNIKWNDIEPVAGQLLVRTAKGGNKRTLPIGLPIIRALTCLRSKQPPKGMARHNGYALYTSRGGQLRYEHIRRRQKQWTTIVFGRAYSFHCLRHTAAIRVYKATEDVLTVQRFLGHKSLLWTETYLRQMSDPGFKGLPNFCDHSTIGLKLFDPENKAMSQTRVPIPTHDCIKHMLATPAIEIDGSKCTCTMCGKFLGFLPNKEKKRENVSKSVRSKWDRTPAA